MNILFDSQIFQKQKYGGISKYFYELMRCLSSSPEIEIQLPVKYTNNHYLFQSGVSYSIPKFHNMKEHSFPGSRTIHKWGNKYFHFDEYENQRKKELKIISSGNYDLMHPTYYDPYFLDVIGKKPFILTIHDMIHELYPDHFSEDNTAENKVRLASAAHHIIAVSENTKADIIKILGIDEKKISVVYHGVDQCNNKYENHGFNIDLPSEYILFVGARESKYKNFNFFIQSISPLLNKKTKLCVVCTGTSFSKEELSLFKDLNISNQIIHRFVREEQISYLYHNALLFIYPSMYEGFGMPIIEAFNALCPVAVSNTSCFPEVAQDAALYFDPTDSSDILKQIQTLTEDHDLRKELIKKGKKRVSAFSLEKTAEQTKNVYRKTIGK